MRVVCCSLLVILFLQQAPAQHSGLNLMPLPQEILLQSGVLRLDENAGVFIGGKPDDRLFAYANRCWQRLAGRCGLFWKQPFASSRMPASGAWLRIEVQRPGRLQPGEDESYTLRVSPEGARLDAATDFGAMRGLETLLQLLQADADGYFFPALEIRDAPRFPWRGLMIDVARHFQPLEVLYRNLDAMAALKMNVLHLHLSDDQGWRIESRAFPRLTQLGSDGLFYTQTQLRDIVQYAAARGIRVLPEIDLPGHSSALLTAYPELASAPGPYQIERNAGAFDPTINPAKEATYRFLDTLLAEIIPLFPDVYFHIGGDENNGKQWAQNPDIQAFMREKGLKDNHALQTYFNQRLLEILQRHGRQMMGWDEILQPGLPQNALIQSWQGKTALYQAARGGYSAILSNGYYIDMMQPASFHYHNDPLPTDEGLTDEQRRRILGGEATMWAELVTPLTIDSRIWPRSAAIAERLWSPREVQDSGDMYRRLELVSLRLEELGLQHLKAPEGILRNLCAGYDTGPLRRLVEVCEPLKLYTRNPVIAPGQTLYKMHSPFTLFADACIPDAPVARRFRELADAYIQSPEDQELVSIQHSLRSWRDNHALLLPLIRRSPVLKEIEQLSARLSDVSALTLQALGKRKFRYTDAEKARFDAAREQGGRSDLQVVEAMRKLLMFRAGVLE